MASMIVDVNPSNAKQTLIRDSNCFFIASRVGEYSLWQMLWRVVVDGSTRPLCNGWYDCRSSRFDIMCHTITAELNPCIR